MLLLTLGSLLVVVVGVGGAWRGRLQSNLRSVLHEPGLTCNATYTAVQCGTRESYACSIVQWSIHDMVMPTSSTTSLGIARN